MSDWDWDWLLQGSGLQPQDFMRTATSKPLPSASADEDSGAAQVPLSAYGPPTTLQDPNASPIRSTPALDQVATGPFFRMTDQQLGAFRDDAEDQARLQAVARDAFAAFARKYIEGLAANPELASTPQTAALLAIPGVIDVYDSMAALSEGQRVQNAYNQALFRSLNDSLNQQAESQAAQRGHGLYMP